MRRIVWMLFFSYFLMGLAWASPGTGIIPEMKECMESHGSQAQYAAVLQKYCDPGIIRQAMGLLVIKEPHIVNTDEERSGDHLHR